MIKKTSMENSKNKSHHHTPAAEKSKDDNYLIGARFSSSLNSTILNMYQCSHSDFILTLVVFLYFVYNKFTKKYRGTLTRRSVLIANA